MESSVRFPTIVLFVLLTISILGHSWEKPGCHLKGYRLLVKKENCQRAFIRINACRGYCASFSYPSSYETIMTSHGRHNFTSHGSCCSIARSQTLRFQLNCGGSLVYETIQSAERCSCGLCKDY